jgi:hypothetical protein
MSTLGTAVTARIGTLRLLGLTNDLNTATTIDTTVLEAACSDAVGLFQNESGFAFNAADQTHLVIAIQGVMYLLEDYKGRDGNIISNHKKQFFAGLNSLRNKAWLAPQSTSNLTPTREQANTRPDMDPTQPAWKFGRQSISVGAVEDNPS